MPPNTLVQQRLVAPQGHTLPGAAADCQEARAPHIALVRATERVTALRQAVEHVLPEIDWATRRRVFIKPNLVASGPPHAITHRDALATVLEAVRARYAGPLTIAEGSAECPTTQVYQAEGYPELAARYGARLLDLNADEVLSATIYGRRGRRLRVRLARSVVESDCRISLAVPKTHDTVLVTLGLKNMVMGALVDRQLAGGNARPAWLDRLGQWLLGDGDGWGNDKWAMHQDYPLINLNLALLAPLVTPHLSVLDGFGAMEGEGPVKGTLVPWNIALASRDALALDLFTAQLMGFAPHEVGYLRYAAELGLGNPSLDPQRVVGNVPPEAVARPFAPHPEHHQQRRWPNPHTAEIMRGLILQRSQR